MKLSIPSTRFSDRRALLASIDSCKREVEGLRQVDGVDRFNQQAVDLLTSGVVDAIDVSKESPTVLAKYDTSEM